MNTIKSVFNVDTKEWTITVGPRCFDLVNLHFGFCGNEEHVTFDHLSFGYTINLDGVANPGESFIGSKNFPDPGVIFSEVFSDYPIVTDLIKLPPEKDLIYTLWVRNAGELTEFSYNFTTTKPDQPFPSWTWNGTEWVAPVARPQALTVPMWWDEEDQTWVEVTDPTQIPEKLQALEAQLAPPENE